MKVSAHHGCWVNVYTVLLLFLIMSSRRHFLVVAPVDGDVSGGNNDDVDGDVSGGNNNDVDDDVNGGNNGDVDGDVSGGNNGDVDEG